jgi:WD40 repeat protein
MFKLIKEIKYEGYCPRFFFDANGIVYESKNRPHWQGLSAPNSPPVILFNPEMYVSDICLSRDGKKYLIGAECGKGMIWNKETKQAIELNLGNKDWCFRVGESTNGNVLLASQSQKYHNIHHFNAENGEYIGKYIVRTGPVMSIVTDEKSKLLFAFTSGEGVVVWNESGMVVNEIIGDVYRGDGPCMSMHRINDSECIFTNSTYIKKAKIDGNWAEAKTVHYFNKRIEKMAATPNPDIVFCSFRGSIRILSLFTGEEKTIFEFPEDSVDQMKVSADGKYLAFTSNNVLRVIEIPDSAYL